jgi:steroid delta-isomerase-like uncharacterized protein
VSIEQVIDRWEAAWSSKDPEAFEPVCADRVHYEDPTVAQPLENLEALVAHAQRLWAAFPDARLERTGERVFNERYIAAPCKLLGTHRAPLEGLPASNRFLVVQCVVYAEVEHELLLRARAFFDLYDAATQLGVLPAHGTLGERALLMLRGFGLRAGRGSE